MFDLSPLKIMIVVTVVLVFLGPDKLPEVARKLGATWKTIKQFREKVESEVREAIPQLPNSGDISRLVRSPIDLLNQLADRADSGEEENSEHVANDDSNIVNPIFETKLSNHLPIDYVTESSPIIDSSLN